LAECKENKIAICRQHLTRIRVSASKKHQWVLVVIVLGSQDSEKGSNMSFATPDP